MTLRASDPKALETWLSAHGFVVPTSVQPAVDKYTSEGFDFIALRLQPGQGVRAMAPVRIVTPGADASLPLRMIAAGIGANVGLTLYVIGEGRYHPQNFPDVTVDDKHLVWDYGQNRSNYQELSLAAMAAPAGRGWLTEYAKQSQLGGDTRSYVNQGRLSDAYYSTCAFGAQPVYGRDLDASLGGDGSASDGAASDGSADAATDAATGSDAAADGSDAADAGVHPVNDAGTGTCQGGSSCCAYDDLKVATRGLHRGDVWITRLRANLPANALSAGDLRLAPTPFQTEVDNNHYAGTAGSAPRTTGAGLGGRTSSAVGSYVTIGLAALALSGMLRRRRQ